MQAYKYLNKAVDSQKQVDSIPKDFIKLNKEKIKRISKLELMTFIENDGVDQDDECLEGPSKKFNMY